MKLVQPRLFVLLGRCIDGEVILGYGQHTLCLVDGFLEADEFTGVFSALVLMFLKDRISYNYLIQARRNVDKLYSRVFIGKDPTY